MKLLLLIFFVNSAISYNFLKDFTDYNVALDSNVESTYYISRAIDLNWVDSYMYCKSVGMRLAKLSSENNLYGVFVGLSQFQGRTSNRLIFDGSDLPKRFGSSYCAAINVSASDYIAIAGNISCTEEAQPFLCEMEPVNEENIVEVNLSKAVMNPPRFLSYLGSFYGNRSENEEKKLKNYFMSPWTLQLSPADAVKLCQSLDMKLAAPETLEEFEHLKNLAKMSSKRWENLILEIYSIGSMQSWGLGGNELPYRISIAEENLTNLKSCLRISKTAPKHLTSESCEKPSQFICEQNSKTKIKKTNFDSAKFLQRYVGFSYAVSNLTIIKNIYTSQKFLSTTWIEALWICKSFGLDLFRPETPFEFDKFQNEIRVNEFLPQSFHFGASRTDSGDKHDRHNIGQEKFKNCAMMLNKNGSYEVTDISCTNVEASFMCQERWTMGVDLEPDQKSYFSVDIFLNDSKPLVEAESYSDPVVVPDTSVCGTSYDILDAEGNYIKTACAVFQATTHDEACVGNGMNLYVVDSNVTEKEVLKFATSMFGSGGQSILWINGRKEHGSWYTYDPEREPLIEGIWRRRKTVPAQREIDDDYNYVYLWKVPNAFRAKRSSSPHKCLGLAAFGDFDVHILMCAIQSYSICEYKKNTVTNLMAPDQNAISAKHESMKTDCDKIADLYRSGKFSSTICLIEKDLTFQEAKKQCHSLGLKLFDPDYDSNGDYSFPDYFDEIILGFFDSHEKVDMWANRKSVLRWATEFVSLVNCQNEEEESRHRNPLKVKDRNECSRITYPLCQTKHHKHLDRKLEKASGGSGEPDDDSVESTTEQQNNYGICSNSNFLFPEMNLGNTLCLNLEKMTYFEAEEACKRNNLKLHVKNLNNSDKVRKTLKKLVGDQKEVEVWIDRYGSGSRRLRSNSEKCQIMNFHADKPRLRYALVDCEEKKFPLCEWVVEAQVERTTEENYEDE